MTSSNNLGSVYTIDNFIDGVWYDLGPHVQVSPDDLGAPALVALPSNIDLTSTDSGTIKLNEKPHVCTECGASFTNSSNLKSHIRTHTGEKPFSCDICGLSFIQSSNLKAHKRIHTGEKPYKCQDCGRCFTRSSHLISHRRIHTGEQPFSCTLCGKSFHTSSHLKLHLNKHEDGNIFVCTVCEKSFSKAAALEIHLQVHNGDRPYFCSECTAAFRSKEDLNVHKKLHLSYSVSPYSCNNCGKGFRILICCQRHQIKCEEASKSASESIKSTSSSTNTSPIHKGVALEMELLEDPLEEGIKDEVDERMFVLTHEDDKPIEIVSFPEGVDPDNGDEAL